MSVPPPNFILISLITWQIVCYFCCLGYGVHYTHFWEKPLNKSEVVLNLNTKYNKNCCQDLIVHLIRMIININKKFGYFGNMTPASLIWIFYCSIFLSKIQLLTKLLNSAQHIYFFFTMYAYICNTDINYCTVIFNLIRIILANSIICDTLHRRNPRDFYPLHFSQDGNPVGSDYTSLLELDV